jgi:DNA adenine methylase
MIMSPLRYPGGKAKLFPFFVELIKSNNSFGSIYCEPYAGGAGLAIRLLTMGFVERVAINDIDPAIYAFWQAVLNRTDEFCRRLEKTGTGIDEWHRQHQIWKRADSKNVVDLGFATFFLNRTNRSGIIEGAGPIGGYHQKGEWKLDVRLVKGKQIENVRSLARFASQIDVRCEDAMTFFRTRCNSPESFVYLDPPYYVKGKKLYKNSYTALDHAKIAALLRENKRKRWVLSYDDVPQIRTLYSGFQYRRYSLSYSAGAKSKGTEVMFASASVKLPSMVA